MRLTLSDPRSPIAPTYGPRRTLAMVYKRKAPRIRGTVFGEIEAKIEVPNSTSFEKEKKSN